MSELTPNPPQNPAPRTSTSGCRDTPAIDPARVSRGLGHSAWVVRKGAGRA
jgi:hypothetical protein